MVKITPNQLRLIKSFDNPHTRISIVTGPAGSGKTNWICKTAQKLYRQKRIDKVVITRPIVSVDEDIVYLPGTIDDKLYPWLIPITDYLDDIPLYEQVSLGMLRGRTFKDSFIMEL